MGKNEQRVRIEGGVLHADGWSTDRTEVVRWFGDRLEAGDDVSPAELLDYVVGAGVLALKTAAVAVDADYVAGEFERLLGSVGEVVGNHGEQLDSMFDPERRDSVVSAIRDVMAEHVDGRDSKMALLLDPENETSPLRRLAEGMHQLAEKVESYRLEVHTRDSADAARALERDKGTQKGRDFEEIVVDALTPIASVFGDTVEGCGDIAGDIGRRKKGDLLVRLNPRDTRGVEMRLALEAKDSNLSMPEILRQLDGAKANRGAGAAILVFARAAQMPRSTAPFYDLGDNRFACLVDKDDPTDTVVLTAAYRLARHWALVDAAVADDRDIDIRAVHDALEHARNQVQAFSILKRKVTELETGFADGVGAIRTQVDQLRLALADALDRLDESVAEVDEEPSADRAA